MTLSSFVAERRERILALASKHGARNLRVFGSMARGDDGDDSDLDLLIETGPKTTPFFPGGLIADLQDLLGRKVDVLTERALPRSIREQVLKDAVPL
jgi:uncharacterized protein